MNFAMKLNCAIRNAKSMADDYTMYFDIVYFFLFTEFHYLTKCLYNQCIIQLFLERCFSS